MYSRRLRRCRCAARRRRRAARSSPASDSVQRRPRRRPDGDHLRRRAAGRASRSAPSPPGLSTPQELPQRDRHLVREDVLDVVMRERPRRPCPPGRGDMSVMLATTSGLHAGVDVEPQLVPLGPAEALVQARRGRAGRSPRAARASPVRRGGASTASPRPGAWTATSRPSPFACRPGRSPAGSLPGSGAATRTARGTSPRYHSSGSPSARSIATTSPIAISWSPAGISSRRSQTIHASAASRIGMPASSRCGTSRSFSRLGHLRGEHARDVLRARAQHVDGEAAGVAHERQRARALLEADERQQRVERDRADGVRGHAALARRPGAR